MLEGDINKMCNAGNVLDLVLGLGSTCNNLA